MLQNGVNLTLGIPIIRTSPDHGTALDIAGKGKASEESLYAAIKKAQEIAKSANITYIANRCIKQEYQRLFLKINPVFPALLQTDWRNF